MRGDNASTTKQSITKQISWLGTAQVSKKLENLLYLKRKGFMRIINRISNRILVYSIYIKNKMKKEIIKYYHSVENGTSLCDKAKLF